MKVLLIVLPNCKCDKNDIKDTKSSLLLIIIRKVSSSYVFGIFRYPFRQNTDFLYLTGFQEPDAVLVLRKWY